MNIFYLAFKNIRRKTFRSIALILCVAIVSGLLFAGSISMKGILTSVSLGAKRLGADLMVVPKGYEENIRSTIIAGKPSTLYMSYDVVNKIKNIKGVKQVSPQLFLKSTTYPCCTDVDVMLIAFDPMSDFTIGPWLKQAISRQLRKDEIIIGRSIPVAIGDKMTFYGKQLTVVGDLSETGFDYIDRGVFMTFETARDMIVHSKEKAVEPLKIAEDSISTVLVQLDPSISAERATIYVEYEVPDVKAIASEDVVGTVKRQLLVLLKVLVGAGIILWAITVVMITVVFSMIVNERQRELGILRSLGAESMSIFSLITLEAIIISVIGGITGIAAGGGILYLLKKPVMTAFKLPYLWPGSEFVIFAAIATILISTITGMVAVFYPAFRCSRMEPYEAIRKGE
ncbi:ABC transporter permease [hot springs metagenome]|uniref:ABC transporter permease n=1 Tax=hot springs metagenome TaxID=433727 RepID=A0A5J4L728_9ZZZZ